MKKEVSIFINTESIPKDDEPRHISTQSKGTLYEKDGLFYITYRENPEEFGKTTTTIKVKNDRIELLRTGNVSSRLVFSKDRPFEGSYNTPYGSLPLRLIVAEMKIDIGDESGSIFMKYSLDFAGDITDNTFTLKYN